MSLFGMARVAGGMGDLETARAKFMASADIAKKMGNKRQMYSCYSELAHVLRENGELMNRWQYIRPPAEVEGDGHRAGRRA